MRTPLPPRHLGGEQSAPAQLYDILEKKIETKRKIEKSSWKWPTPTNMTIGAHRKQRKSPTSKPNRSLELNGSKRPRRWGS